MLTPMQERYRHIDNVLTPELIHAILRTKRRVPAWEWAEMLGCSKQLIERLRSRRRKMFRKPMGGDRRSEEWRQRSEGA